MGMYGLTYVITAEGNRPRPRGNYLGIMLKRYYSHIVTQRVERWALCQSYYIIICAIEHIERYRPI